jgi:hypothetical protein
MEKRAIQPGDCLTVDNLEVKSWSGFGSTVDPVFLYQLFTPLSMTMAVYPQFMVFFLFSSSAAPSLCVGPFLWVCGLDYFIELFNSTIGQCNLNLEIVS